MIESDWNNITDRLQKKNPDLFDELNIEGTLAYLYLSIFEFL